jgi:hypothetical protein
MARILDFIYDPILNKGSFRIEDLQEYEMRAR